MLKLCLHWVFAGAEVFVAAEVLTLNIWSPLTSLVMLLLPQKWVQNPFTFPLPQMLNGNGP